MKVLPNALLAALIVTPVAPVLAQTPQLQKVENYFSAAHLSPFDFSAGKFRSASRSPGSTMLRNTAQNRQTLMRVTLMNGASCAGGQY